MHAFSATSQPESPGGSASATFGAIVGQLAGRRLPGTPIAWAASGDFGIFTATCGRGRRWLHRDGCSCGSPRRSASPSRRGKALLVAHSGPANTAGSLAMGLATERSTSSFLGRVTVMIVGVCMLQHVSRRARTAEQLGRTASLASPCRSTTVILLRRQLNQEQTRPPMGPGGGSSDRRGVPVSRFPTRLVRMTAAAAMAGVFQAMVVADDTGIARQCIDAVHHGLSDGAVVARDRPTDRTDSLPIRRGELLVRHLIAPAVKKVPFALIAAAAWSPCSALVQSPALILALLTVLGGAAGAWSASSAMHPTTSGTQAFLPPEMAE